MRPWLVAACVLAHCAPAGAAVVEERYFPCSTRDCGPPDLVFEADPGETNDVTIRQADNTVVIEDAGADLRVGSGCRADSARRATCMASSVKVSLGDGDDRSAADGMAFARVDGGPGDDLLRGGPGPDAFIAGPGRDTVLGGDGDDTIEDGGRFVPSGEDVFDGGPGQDVVTYTLDPRPLRIDLAAGSASAGFERDALAGLEVAAGGAADDIVAGDDGRNALSGGGGRDLLLGRGGPDALSVFAATADGGPGDDELSDPLRTARMTCGDGRDTVLTSGSFGPRVPADCEVAGEPGSLISLYLPLPSLSAPFASRPAERNTIKVRPAAGRGKGRLLASNSTRPRLNARGRSLLRRRGVLEVALRSEGSDFRVVLRLP